MQRRYRLMVRVRLNRAACNLLHMKTGPRYKIAKRLGVTVFEKAQTQKFAIAADRASRGRRGRGNRQSEYGKQLLEKQKVRVTYGLPERQFKSYVQKAFRLHAASPAEKLHEILELRLDNVVWRLGLVSTRRGARQFVAHGHVLVNGKRVRVPSAELHPGDRVAIREGSKKHGLLVGFNDKFMERSLPSWLTFDPKKMEGGIKERPTTTSADPAGDLSAVLSFYTR